MTERILTPSSRPVIYGLMNDAGEFHMSESCIAFTAAELDAELEHLQEGDDTWRIVPLFAVSEKTTPSLIGNLVKDFGKDPGLFSGFIQGERTPDKNDGLRVALLVLSCDDRLSKSDSQMLIQAADALKSAPSAIGAPTWIKVSERRPEGNEDVIVAYTGKLGVGTRGANWVRACYDEVIRGVDETCAFTHWMPMPSAPTDGKGDSK